MSNKPKEFWICRGEHVGDFDCRKPFYSSVFTKEDLVQLALAERERTSLVQVVDKASYDQVCKERDELKAKLDAPAKWVRAEELEKWKSWAEEARALLPQLRQDLMSYNDYLVTELLAQFPGDQDE